MAAETKCIVCGAGNVRVETVMCKLDEESIARSLEVVNKSIEAHFCRKCGHCGIPGNTGGYDTADEYPEGSRPSADGNVRVGDGQRPGREFRMMVNALKVVQGKKLDGLFYGAGLSPDYKLAKSRKRIGQVAVTDTANFMATDAFIPMSSRAKFDIVIACEVVEHFTDPHGSFANLLGFAKNTGLVICSTNIHNGKPIEKVRYPFIKGHASYYSGESMQIVAERSGFQCDFRLPACVNGRGGPRKRYVFLYKKPSVQRRIARFFATHPYALSE